MESETSVSHARSRLNLMFFLNLSETCRIRWRKPLRDEPSVHNAKIPARKSTIKSFRCASWRNHANFAIMRASMDDAIRDQLIEGLRDQQIVKELLKQRNLTLVKEIELA